MELNARRARNYMLKKGLEEGRKEGIEVGLEKGKRQEKIEIANKLLELDTSIEDIIKITGLTKEEVLDIKKNK